MLQIIFSDNDWLICLNWHPLNIPKPRPFLYLMSVWRWAEHSSHFTALLSGYVDTDLTPRAHIQTDVNSRVERVALNYFDVTVRVRLAHAVFTIAASDLSFGLLWATWMLLLWGSAWSTSTTSPTAWSTTRSRSSKLGSTPETKFTLDFVCVSDALCCCPELN